MPNLIHSASGDGKAIKFLLDGLEAGTGGYEPAVAWMDVCRAFQRIRPSEKENLPKIHVVFQHSVSGDEIPELHRLSRFAHNNPEQYGTILDWLAQVHTNGQGLIEYDCDSEPYPGFQLRKDSVATESTRYEWIEYIIPLLNNNENRPLKGLPSRLYRSYHKYRKDSETE